MPPPNQNFHKHACQLISLDGFKVKAITFKKFLKGEAFQHSYVRIVALLSFLEEVGSSKYETLPVLHNCLYGGGFFYAFVFHRLLCCLLNNKIVLLTFQSTLLWCTYQAINFGICLVLLYATFDLVNYWLFVLLTHIFFCSF